MFMQLDKQLSPVHCLASFDPYQEILARSGADRSMCPMYTLVLEELERQYRAHSDFFTEDNQCLTDVIMSSQATEREGDAHESEKNSGATSKNMGYEAGRLARGLAIESMKEESKARGLARAEAEGRAKVLKA